MNEFLNPKSMLTPGAAGALMMLIANTLCNMFPELAFRYVALGMSFLIGGFIVASAALGAIERGSYWVLNSLIIFSVGVGTTNIAANVERRAADPTQSMIPWVERLASNVVPAANAQAPAPAAAAVPKPAAVVPGKTAETAKLQTQAVELQRIQLENQRLKEELEVSKKEAARQDLTKARMETREGFFKRW